MHNNVRVESSRILCQSAVWNMIVYPNRLRARSISLAAGRHRPVAIIHNTAITNPRK